MHATGLPPRICHHRRHGQSNVPMHVKPVHEPGPVLLQGNQVPPPTAAPEQALTPAPAQAGSGSINGSSSSSRSGGGGANIGAIVGCIIGGLAALLLLVGACSTPAAANCQHGSCQGMHARRLLKLLSGSRLWVRRPRCCWAKQLCDDPEAGDCRRCGVGVAQEAAAGQAGSVHHAQDVQAQRSTGVHRCQMVVGSAGFDTVFCTPDKARVHKTC